MRPKTNSLSYFLLCAMITLSACSKAEPVKPNTLRVAAVEYINAGLQVAPNDILVSNVTGKILVASTLADSLNLNTELTAQYDIMLSPEQYAVYQAKQKMILYVSLNGFVRKGNILEAGMRICNEKDGRLHPLTASQAVFYTEDAPTGYLLAIDNPALLTPDNSPTPTIYFQWKEH